MWYLVAYDIGPDRRRNKVFRILKKYGRPVQFSVVECELDGERLAAMREELAGVVVKRVDKVDIYPMCERCYFRAERMGKRELGPEL